MRVLLAYRKFCLDSNTMYTLTKDMNKHEDGVKDTYQDR